jgi:hypothetical protein
MPYRLHHRQGDGLLAARLRPFMQVRDQVDEPLVVHGQEVLKVIDAPAPPVFHVAVA